MYTKNQLIITWVVAAVVASFITYNINKKRFSKGVKTGLIIDEIKKQEYHVNKPIIYKLKEPATVQTPRVYIYKSGDDWAQTSIASGLDKNTTFNLTGKEYTIYNIVLAETDVKNAMTQKYAGKSIWVIKKEIELIK
jgi:hypothetical protein